MSPWNEAAICYEFLKIAIFKIRERTDHRVLEALFYKSIRHEYGDVMVTTESSLVPFVASMTSQLHFQLGDSHLLCTCSLSCLQLPGTAGLKGRVNDGRVPMSPPVSPCAMQAPWARRWVIAAVADIQQLVSTQGILVGPKACCGSHLQKSRLEIRVHNALTMTAVKGATHAIAPTSG